MEPSAKGYRGSAAAPTPSSVRAGSMRRPWREQTSNTRLCLPWSESDNGLCVAAAIFGCLLRFNLFVRALRVMNVFTRQNADRRIR